MADVFVSFAGTEDAPYWKAREARKKAEQEAEWQQEKQSTRRARTPRQSPRESRPQPTQASK